MKSLITFFLVGVFLSLNAQTIHLKTFDELESYWKSDYSDTLLVVNFWATWCKPCVAELPCFQNVQTKKFQKPIQLIFVSLDHPQDLQTRVRPILKKNNISAECWILKDENPNKWINKVSEHWSGAIPATLLIQKSGTIKDLVVRSFECEELEAYLIQTLNTKP
jgi:thiol-disulfide isomerase/thioredoxin